MAEQFTFKITIEGDKNENHFPSWKTKIERTVEVSATYPHNIDHAVSMLTKSAVSEIIEALIERDEQAEKEPEE